MALPSAVPLGALAFVLAAGAGLVTGRADALFHGAPPNTPAAPTAKHRSAATETPPRAATTRAEVLQRRAARAHPEAAPHVLVELFNNSSVSGLAAHKAILLEGAGWNVAATDNWYGTVPATTVYYPPRLRAEARHLAKTLGGVRMRPAVAPMQFDRLTVIFTAP
jgi:LytR cell envelope-related transcriptional attenuator